MSLNSIVDDLKAQGIVLETPDDFLGNSSYLIAKHFKVAFRKGWAAYDDGKTVFDMPYKSYWATGRKSPISLVWEKCWIDGYQVKQLIDAS